MCSLKVSSEILRESGDGGARFDARLTNMFHRFPFFSLVCFLISVATSPFLLLEHLHLSAGLSHLEWVKRDWLGPRHMTVQLTNTTRLGWCWGRVVAKGAVGWREVEWGGKFYFQIKILFRRGRGSAVPGALARAWHFNFPSYISRLIAVLF